MLYCGLGIVLVLTLSSRGWCAPEISVGPTHGSLSIQSVQFEPILAARSAAVMAFLLGQLAILTRIQYEKFGTFAWKASSTQ